jgi:hypothetical protein
VYYAKFVYAMLYLYFQPAAEWDFRLPLQNRAWTFYVARSFSADKGNAFMVRLGKEFADAVPPPAVLITERDPNVPMSLDDRILIPATPLWRVYQLTRVARTVVSSRWAWPVAMAGVVGLSVVMLWRTRLRHDAVFAVFIVAASAIGAALVVSLVEYSQPRYSYPMEWSYAMSVVLCPLLFIRPSGDARVA